METTINTLLSLKITNKNFNSNKIRMNILKTIKGVVNNDQLPNLMENLLSKLESKILSSTNPNQIIKLEWGGAEFWVDSLVNPQNGEITKKLRTFPLSPSIKAILLAIKNVKKSS